jgi:hypothetical protein
MPRIHDSRGRSDENSGYTRLLGNAELGHLLSRVQATVIRSGNELERLLSEHSNVRHVTVDHIMGQTFLPHDNIEIAFEPRLLVRDVHIKSDILIADHPKRVCKVIELKDGDTFDTKKASGELASLSAFSEELNRQTGYQVTYHFCSFNQTSRIAIVKGAKGRFTEDEVLTGRELCELMGIDFESILEYRKLQQQENLEFFLTNLSNIHEVREYLRQLLCRYHTKGIIND